MRPFDRTLPFILLSSSDSSVPSSVPAAGRMPSLIAKALHVFFSSHVDAFILTSLIHAVVFVIDFFSASWFRECCMSGLFLLGIVINKHTGHRIVAIAAIFIIHAKREIFCSYGGLTFYGALNMFINTVAITKQRESRADGPPYAYGPLGASQIRLLRTSRRLPFTELQCELIHTTFDEGPEYTAISYTWNDATPKHEVLIGGRRAAINSSVYDILHHQRSYVGQKIIWIESICINQSDNEEKAKQAKLKGDIFC
jgi:hypothetical protein